MRDIRELLTNREKVTLQNSTVEISEVETNKLRSSFYLFNSYMFYKVGHNPPSELQKDYCEDLQHNPNKFICYLCYRGFGKSEIILNYVVWFLWNNPTKHVWIGSATEGKAVDFSSSCKNKIDNTWFLKEALNPDNGDKRRWSERSFDVFGKNPDDKERSVRCTSIEAQVTGGRADLFILDDIETSQSVKTLTGRENVDLFISEIYKLLTGANTTQEQRKKGNVNLLGSSKIIILGTPHHSESVILSKANSKSFSTMIIPVAYPSITQLKYYKEGTLNKTILERLYNDPSLIGKATDPDRKNDKEVELHLSELSSFDFNQQYMLINDPVLLEEKLFDISGCFTDDVYGKNILSVINKRDSDDRLYEGNYSIRLPKFSTFKKKVRDIYIVIDPSGRGRDETAMGLIGISGKFVIVMDMVGYQNIYQGEGESKFNAKLKEYLSYTSKVMLESNWADGAGERDIRNRVKKIGLNCSIREVRSKGEKGARIYTNLNPVINNGNVIFDKELIKREFSKLNNPSSTPYEKASCLIHQIIGFDIKLKELTYDDRLDCLSIYIGEIGNSLNEDRDYFEEDDGNIIYTKEILEQMFGSAVDKEKREFPKIDNRGRDRIPDSIL